MPRYTGPGLSDMALLYALLTYSGIRRGSNTVRAHLVTGATMACWSISCKESLSFSSTPDLPEIIRKGAFDIYAPATPVRALVKPGPAVTRHTPGVFETLP